MGLGLFEVVLEVEKSFAISLRDVRSPEIPTVGDMYDRVLEILSRGYQEGADLGDSVSERIRQSLESVRGKPQQEISSDKPLRGLFPVFGRRRSWNRFGESLGLDLPPLRRPQLVDAMLVGLAAVFGWTFAILTPLELIPKESILSYSWIAIPLIMIAGALTIFLLWLLGRLLTVPIAVFWPRGVCTIRHLEQWILATHYGKVVEQEKRFSSNEVWGLLQRIVASVLEVDIQKVTRDARFVEDLGAD